ncbi:hypothetical protein F6J84_07515 [Microbacterium caowuchunii]|uniref:DUF6157 family protein n=1 Tax=Microbacterium caowuchunii TaxID=2614638 RepID=UPI0012479448|nr:DUF6157 family protein [Microbacterium caowuchunii]QEV99963.1 hypothetical protein F6J84_07515 [Microbacterium caowuchunii]
MGSTNYRGTFIQVAEDCPVEAAEPPPSTGKAPTVAALQYALVSEHPYEYTSDDVLFEVHATRQSIDAEERAEAREAFFAKDQACLRSSPLGKRYGWGIHHDAEGRVAVVPLGSDEYRALAADPSVTQVKAMRSKRA